MFPFVFRSSVLPFFLVFLLSSSLPLPHIFLSDNYVCRLPSALSDNRRAFPFRTHAFVPGINTSSALMPTYYIVLRGSSNTYSVDIAVAILESDTRGKVRVKSIFEPLQPWVVH